jgi:hypothetical protein
LSVEAELGLLCVAWLVEGLVCGVLLGDVLWAATQLAPKSNTDNIVALAFIMSKPSGKMIF